MLSSSSFFLIFILYSSEYSSSSSWSHKRGFAQITGKSDCICDLLKSVIGTWSYNVALHAYFILIRCYYHPTVRTESRSIKGVCFIRTYSRSIKPAASRTREKLLPDSNNTMYYWFFSSTSCCFVVKFLLLLLVALVDRAHFLTRSTRMTTKNIQNITDGSANVHLYCKEIYIYIYCVSPIVQRIEKIERLI